MALDCGKIVFIHIPRTAGKYTRALLADIAVGEVGEIHGLPPKFYNNKLYFCWKRDQSEWIASIEKYLQRPAGWWDSRKQIEPTWAYLRETWLELDKDNFRYWLVNWFLTRYYKPEVEVIPFEQHIQWLHHWVGINRFSVPKKVAEIKLTNPFERKFG